MKRYLTLILAACLCACTPQMEQQNPEVAAASALAQRVLPSQASNIVFILEPADSEYFEFCTVDDKLVIKGANTLDMAVGLNNYLKDYCNIEVSWYARDAVPALKRLPVVEQPFRRTALLRDRFFLNYCTYGYSLVWWGWKEWERLIDWMALNGVNMSLSQAGQEAVWQKVWMEMGLSAEQTREFFTGPAFLPWHRMTNIDSWHGPLPQKWIDSQAQLQKKIVAREVSLGIQPILSCFSGHVPAALKDVYPDADISAIKPWAGFTEEYQCHYLNPADSLYGKIQKAYLLTQQEFYGKDSHIYGLDPFNEIEPPTWDPEYLASVGDRTYRSMVEVDPDTVWLQMGWVFWYMRRQWTPERVKAYLSPVPKGRLLMLDYYCENQEVYRMHENFYGQDFIWSFLGNFGENHMISQQFQKVSEKIDRTFEDAPDEFKGVGCTLEGLGVDPPMWAFVLDKAWSRSGGDEEFIRKVADCHLGYADENFRQAWMGLYEKCCGHSGGQCTMLHEWRPSLDARPSQERIGYSNDDLMDVWACVTRTKPSDNPQFRFDCANIARQWLENEFYLTYPAMIAAYDSTDVQAFDEVVGKMTSLVEDIATIDGTVPYFSLGRYIDSARSMGDTRAEKEYYERDARLIISTWGAHGNDDLVDYSARSFDGLTRDYYAPRWDELYKRLRASMESGETFDREAYHKWCQDFEWAWATEDRTVYPAKAKADPFSTCCSLYRKWSGMTE